MTGWGERLARAWVAFYTRGLPPEVAERRRGELASDLFEHTSGGSTPQAEVLGRVLWGIPADLSWRRAARAPRRRRLPTGATMTLRNVSTVVFAVYALFNVWAAVGIIFNPDGGGLPWGLPLLGAAVLMALGLAVATEPGRRTPAPAV